MLAIVRGPPGISPSPQHVTQLCRLCAFYLRLFFFFDVQELQEQLQSSEREKEMYRQQLTRAEETIRRVQQQMRQQVSDCGIACSVWTH